MRAAIAGTDLEPRGSGIAFVSRRNAKTTSRTRFTGIGWIGKRCHMLWPGLGGGSILRRLYRGQGAIGKTPKVGSLEAAGRPAADVVVNRLSIGYAEKPGVNGGMATAFGKRRALVELHQIRYFLALTKTLNFTRAAEECNVSQPALSRAISQLEGELGAELFRRERSLTHLTEFGHKVLPELRQCYDASLNARAVAREFLKEGQAPLSVALSRTIEMDSLSPILSELAMAFPKIEIRISRGPPHEIGEKLKSGEAEVGISGPLGDDWERLDGKKLYVQQFGLLLTQDHPLSMRSGVELADLKTERLLSRPYCAMSELLATRLKELGAHNIARLEVPSMDDLPGLVSARFGVGVWPVGRILSGGLAISPVHGVDLSRWVHVHTVFGRRLSAGAAAFIGLLRTRDWPQATMPGDSPREATQ